MNVLNSAGIEILCRRCYGLEASLEHVFDKTEMKAKGRKFLRKYYDLVGFRGAVAPKAEAAALGEMKLASTLSKHAPHGDGAGPA